jgi:thiol-disulfide isomerase/thioredoxin
MFISNHCPYVKHVATELGRLGSDYGPQGVAIVAIGSNDVETHPDDAPVRMVEFAAANGFTFPYLRDESQEVALAYRAACTPDFFVFDSDRRLVYRGQLDGARPSNDLPFDGRDLRAALDAALDGRDAPEPQLPSMGCNIKWKPGNAPDYFLA